MEMFNFLVALSMIFACDTSHVFFTKLVGRNDLDPSFTLFEMSRIYSSISCAETCTNLDDCWSFGFHTLKKICIYTSLILNETVVGGTDHGWDYFVAEDTCEASWTRYGTSCYKIEEDPRNFSDAQVNCGLMDSYIINIDDYQENTFVGSLIDPKVHSFYWIGLSNKVQLNTFLWYPSLKEPNFTFWDVSQPNYDPIEPCVVISKHSMKWSDCRCHYTGPYICERELKT